MRIVLIYPDYYDIAHFGNRRKEIPPFGVMYLASTLEKSGEIVEIIGVSPENVSLDLTSYDVVCFSIPSSVTFATVHNVRNNSLFKENVLLIVGGIHATIFPKEVFLALAVDVLCIGEGEATIEEVVHHYDDRNFNEIKGILFKSNEELIFTEERELIRNLDLLPFPSRHLLPLEDIVMNDRLSDTNLPIAHILCSRGCPCACNFCANLEHTIRYRSAKNIREELEELIKVYGIKGFCITDDNFIINKRRVAEICDEITPLNLKWSSLSRVDTVDQSLLEKLKESGCIEIKYGIESGSPRILELMNKRISIDQIRNAVMLTQNAGIKVKAFILHGFPGENIESTNETISLLNELKDKIDRISIFRFVPLPGSPAYNDKDKHKLELPEDFDEIFIYNNERKWWGTEKDQDELEKSYQLLETFVKDNWEKA